jgi:hypothetical protein
MLVAGTLAIVSLASGTLSQLQPVTTPVLPSLPSQSSFYTTTTNLGVATVTEILVNTDIQFPIGDRTILPTSLWNSVQVYAVIVILSLGLLLILLSFSRRA